MRVVLLVTDLERGGTPLRLARLARGLRGVGVDVHVGCLAPTGPVSADLATTGIPTFACQARNAYDWTALQRLSRHVERIRPDLIHATLTHANVAARLIGAYHRIPVLTSTATIEVERHWHRWAELLTARLDRGHIVNSITLAEHVVRSFRLPRQHVSIVPPCIEHPPLAADRARLRADFELPEHEFVVLWAGRFDPVKRLPLVLDCAEIMDTTRFLLAGDGPERARITQALRLSSAARTTQLLGWRDDLPQLMAAADALLFPSRTEGMPNVVLQAMAAGLPIVASDIPTLRELAGANERMLLVAGDEPRPFADALIFLQHSHDYRHQLARRAAVWAAEHLNPARTLEAILRIYRRVLRARRCRQ
ncbi:MAG: glycosyltransferase [Planctomycetota bacterium]